MHSCHTSRLVSDASPRACRMPPTKVAPHSPRCSLAAKLEENAGKYWDEFYRNNADKFFKER